MKEKLQKIKICKPKKETTFTYYQDQNNEYEENNNMSNSFEKHSLNYNINDQHTPKNNENECI